MPPPETGLRRLTHGRGRRRWNRRLRMPRRGLAVCCHPPPWARSGADKLTGAIQVILLEDVDALLEERQLADHKRNALVAGESREGVVGVACVRDGG